jgi:hypothetical protein
LKGVDVIFHLVSTERQGSHSDLSGVDIEGTEKSGNCRRRNRRETHLLRQPPLRGSFFGLSASESKSDF